MDDKELAEILRPRRRRDLIEPATVHGKTLRSERARQHLMEGFNRRVLMLECSIEHIEKIAEEAGDGPLSTYAVPELAVHVNSVWMNLCGALDNLAWAIAYEFELFSNLSELPGEGRDLIGLGKPKYLDTLAQHDRELADQLRTYIGWQTDLRDLRDPAAHRIPIYPVPGILSGAKADEAKKLFDQANSLMGEGKLDEGLALINEGESLANYQPWIILSHQGKLEPRHLHRQMYADEDKFVQIAEIVLNRIFGKAAGYRAI